MLDNLLANDRSVFEHFTHDASVIPIEFLPFWKRQFRRKKEKLDQAQWFKGLPDQHEREIIKNRIGRDGPLSTHAFDTKITGPKKMWSRPPHKLALDYMWYAGELATSHRINFNKYYDLADRIFPESLRELNVPDQDQIDWLCYAALDRMGFGLPSEIQQYWDAVSPKEVNEWLTSTRARVQEVEIETSEGQWINGVALANIEDRLVSLTPATSRLRILNPFDPVIRDRKRLKRLFGFDYRVEMFVPAAKRIWGYYVYPILEGHQFVGRIEIKGDRKNSVLNITNFWLENGKAWPESRYRKLFSELERVRKFIGVNRVEWND
jgi:uncharacterized protein YcaQ